MNIYFFLFKKITYSKLLNLGPQWRLMLTAELFCVPLAYPPALLVFSQCHSIVSCFYIVLHLIFLFNNQNYRTFCDVVLIRHRIQYIIEEKWNRKKQVKIAALSFLRGSQLLIKDVKWPIRSVPATFWPEDLWNGVTRVGGREGGNHFQLLLE